MEGHITTVLRESTPENGTKAISIFLSFFFPVR